MPERIAPQGDRPSHPRRQATLLMVGIVVLLVVLALASMYT
jgi:hypothetical protein